MLAPTTRERHDDALHTKIDVTYSYGANKSVFTLTILAVTSLLCVALLES